MKRILLLVTLFASLIAFTACGSSNKYHTISNPDDLYLTAKEGSFVYTITNKKVYETLKSQVGYTLLMDAIDKDLLKSIEKNGKSYWNQVTDEEVTEKLEKDIFPNGKDKLTEEEISKKKEKHLENLFIEYGLKSEAEVNDYYHLLLAKELYAKDQIVKDYADKKEEDKEKEFKNYFDSNYKDGFHAIIVSFDSFIAMETSLKQLGYALKDDTIKKTDGTSLTDSEITKVFIDLYNMKNASKLEGYPQVTLTINEGEEYNFVSGSYKFNLEKLEKLFYSNKEINMFDSTIANRLQVMKSYDEDGEFYTNKPFVSKSGSRYSLFLKINQVKYNFEEQLETIKKEIYDSKITNSYISRKMMQLRLEKEIVIFDKSLETVFINSLEKKEDYKPNKKIDSTRKKTVVAVVNGKDYTADFLFGEMDKTYGISAAISEIEYLRYLYNTNINDVYNINNKEVLDPTKWTTIKQSLKDEKNNFKKGIYAEHGFPKSYGWENFLRDVYGVESEEELEKFFLFQAVKDRYATSLGKLEGLTETSELWLFYKEQMEKMVSEFFHVKGVHLLITINDSKGNPVDPKEWTEDQNAYAKEFYNQVMEFLKTIEKEDYEKQLKNIENAFNKAPLFVPGLPQDTASQKIEGLNFTYEGIEISKFKSIGLVALFQDLNTFKNGTMVKEFNDAAKSIWDKNSDSSEVVVYDFEKGENGEHEYLKTQFGYHVYVNKNTFPIPKITSSEDQVLATLADIQEYIKNNDSTKLSSSMKTSIRTYYEPIHTELTSNDKLQVTSYKAIKGLDITFNNKNYSNEDFVRFLTLTIESKESNLKYK